MGAGGFMKILTRILTLIYMAMLCYVSIQPGPVGKGADTVRQVVNNILHIPAYGLLVFLIIKSFPKFKHIYIASFLFAVAFGVFNEYLQSFVPGRYPSIMDVLLNGIGSLIVALFYAKRRRVDQRP